MFTALIDSNIPLLTSVFCDNENIIEFNPNELNANLIKQCRANAIFCRSTIKANKDLLADSRIEFIATATSGSDHFDKEYLNANNIAFFDALGSNSNSVAEYIAFAILHWAKLENKDLDKLTIGIIGFGNVGSKVAKYANRLGLTVFINDPPLKDANVQFPDFVEYAEKDELLKKCDIITNHVPLIKDGKYKTINLIGKEEIELIKSNSLFLAASRGKVVDEISLINAIDQKAISVICDVWENEPIISKELALKSLIATPHIAGHSFEGKIRGSLMVAEAYAKYYNKKIDLSSINSSLSAYHSLELQEYKNRDELYRKLLDSRKILEDANYTKETVEKSEKENIEFFKNYRKNYPIRNETL